MQYTPDGFAQALRRTAKAVEGREAKAIDARARITKDGILAAAKAVKHFGPVLPRWVQYEVQGSGGSAFAKVRLRGGFAILTDRGSWIHAGGWDEVPKATSRSRKTARRRQGLKRGMSGPADISGVGSHGVLANVAAGFGPYARVHHKPFAPRPFFKAGIAASKGESLKAYDAVIRGAIAEALR